MKENDIEKRNPANTTNTPIFIRWIDAIAEIGGKTSGIFMLITALIICYSVVMRYVFHSPPFWATEISVYLCIAMGFIGASYTLKNDEHFSITLVIDMLSARNRRIVRTITNLIGAVYSIVFIFKGIEMARFSYEFNDVSQGLLEFPLWIPQSLVPIGGFLLLLQFIKRILSEFVGTVERIQIT